MKGEQRRDTREALLMAAHFHGQPLTGPVAAGADRIPDPPGSVALGTGPEGPAAQQPAELRALVSSSVKRGHPRCEGQCRCV